MSIYTDLAAAYCARHFRSLDDESRKHVHGFAAFLDEIISGAHQAPTEATVETATYPDGTQATGAPPLPAESPVEQQPVEVVILPPADEAPAADPAAGQGEQPSAPAGD